MTRCRGGSDLFRWDVAELILGVSEDLSLSAPYSSEEQKPSGVNWFESPGLMLSHLGPERDLRRKRGRHLCREPAVSLRTFCAPRTHLGLPGPVRVSWGPRADCQAVGYLGWI